MWWWVPAMQASWEVDAGGSCEPWSLRSTGQLSEIQFQKLIIVGNFHINHLFWNLHHFPFMDPFYYQIIISFISIWCYFYFSYLLGFFLLPSAQNPPKYGGFKSKRRWLSRWSAAERSEFRSWAPIEKPGTVTHICCPSTRVGSRERQRPLAGHPAELVSSRFS